MNLPFIKYCATGNDFVVVDNRSGFVNDLSKKNWELICHRRFGVGADGVLLLENSSKYDFKMRYLNADGIEVEMCGNGARTIASFAHHKLKLKTDNHYIFETMDDVCHAEIMEDNEVKIKMGKSLFLDTDLEDIRKEYFFKSAHMLNTGVPHAVFELEEGFRGLDIVIVGARVRYDKRFENGTNVNFFYMADDAKDSSRKHIYLRTYERGVEGETLSCGTGAVACALTCASLYKLNSPVEIHMIGGNLKVSFDHEEGLKFSNVYLQAEVLEIYEGIMNFVRS